MRNFSDIKYRIKSISDTRKITGAMETISVSKMQKAMRRYENNKAYFETLRNAMSEIILHAPESGHKVFEKTAEKHPLYIVIASDKGLAGGFNHNVLSYAESLVSGNENVKVFTVGQVCREYFSARNIDADGSFADASYDPSIAQAAEMSEKIYSLFESGAVDSAYIVFSAMGEQAKSSVQKMRLLPFVREEIAGNADERVSAFDEAIYDPGPEEVLDMLIPQYLTGMIYGALIKSAASEHSERRSAMNSATRNADRLLEELHVEYNRARQEAVTGELIEIVTAANGVQNEH